MSGSFGFVVFIWVRPGGSFEFVEFLRARAGSRRVHSGSVGSLGCVQRIVAGLLGSSVNRVGWLPAFASVAFTKSGCVQCCVSARACVHVALTGPLQCGSCKLAVGHVLDLGQVF